LAEGDFVAALTMASPAEHPLTEPSHRPSTSLKSLEKFPAERRNTEKETAIHAGYGLSN